jgi:hypothetical protein
MPVVCDRSFTHQDIHNGLVVENGNVLHRLNIELN